MDKILKQDKIDWVKNILNSGIKAIIVSNTIDKEKVSSVASKLGLSYTLLSRKPKKSAFLNAAKKMELEPNEVASIGDQIFTDVLGANRVNMLSILVKPLEKKDLIITKPKRPFEKIILKIYMRKKGEGKCL